MDGSSYECGSDPTFAHLTSQCMFWVLQWPCSKTVCFCGSLLTARDMCFRRVDEDFIGSQRPTWDAGKQVVASAVLAAAWLRAGRRMAPERWRAALPVVESAMRAAGAFAGL